MRIFISNTKLSNGIWKENYEFAFLFFFSIFPFATIIFRYKTYAKTFLNNFTKAVRVHITLAGSFHVCSYKTLIILADLTFLFLPPKCSLIFYVAFKIYNVKYTQVLLIIYLGWYFFEIRLCFKYYYT